jgi:hypothetical protein
MFLHSYHCVLCAQDGDDSGGEGMEVEQQRKSKHGASNTRIYRTTLLCATIFCSSACSCRTHMPAQCLFECYNCFVSFHLPCLCFSP